MILGAGSSLGSAHLYFSCHFCSEIKKELIELKKTTKQEISESILAKENAENELEQVKAQLEESEDETVQLENEVSKLKIANANAPNACKIDTDDQKMPMKNECSELKMELDGLKSNLKPNMNQGILTV